LASIPIFNLLGVLNLFIFAAVLLVGVGTIALIYATLHPKRKTYAYALAVGLPTDPGELGMEYVEHQFRFADGSTTQGWSIQGAAPSGPIVIISHGWNSSRYGALLRVAMLAPYASRVVVYDLRGHGDSTASTAGMGVAEVDDLACLIEQLDVSGTGVPGAKEVPVVLYGSSMGAGISIAVAGSAPNPVAGRIIGVIADGPYRYFLEPMIGQLRARKLPAFPCAWLARAYWSLRVGGLGGYDRVGYARRLDGALLVLHGTADPICRFESGKQIAAAANSGRLVAFEGGGHGDLVAVDQTLYEQSLEAFFSGL